ncbi:hypothetical protein MVES1_002374 [Malassezia vespertilionis]|nr:uncharacterized protein MVES1_002374 [Malassezia vespertilionis]WFD07018.1 hypothetical protein MVES1_002374 [Malassezia vespertilionis]
MIMRRGTKIHDALERAVQPVRTEIRVETVVDEYAYCILQFAARVHAARTHGCAREVPVFGWVHGWLVRGIVDELRGGEGNGLVLSDTKTRHSEHLPSEPDQRQAQLQCMLYKRLADTLYTTLTGQATRGMDPFAAPTDLYTALRLAPESLCSASFQHDICAAAESTCMPWSAAAIPASLQLRDVLALAHSALHTQTTQYALISNAMQVVYIQRGAEPANVLGTCDFHADPYMLEAYLDSTFALFRGARDPQGVALHVTNRCKRCAWREGCEWREERAADMHARAEERLRAREDDALWLEFAQPDKLAGLQW